MKSQFPVENNYKQNKNVNSKFDSCNKILTNC